MSDPLIAVKRVHVQHLAFRTTAVGAVGVGLDGLTDREPIGGIFGGNGGAFADALASTGLQDGAGLEKCLDSVPAVFSADAGMFESAPGGLRIVRHAVDHDPARTQLRSNAARASNVCSEDRGV